MYSPDNVQRLRLGYLTVSETYSKLMMQCLSISTADPKSREYLQHGFLRRLGILQRCIQNVYRIFPVERSELASRDETLDVTINLQSFIFNIFGSIDNLAWVWVTEKQVRGRGGKSLRAQDVAFRSEAVNKTLPSPLRDYLHSLKPWFEYMEEFRHALAHRIPLYVPPYTVPPADVEKHNELEIRKAEALQHKQLAEYDRLNHEQIKLGRFTPAMTHSHSESSGSIAFHTQMLADWNTVAEIASNFFEALKEPTS